jgi:hypothetical protein
MTGRKLILETDDRHAEAAKTLFPAAVWLVCFVILFARRQLRISRPSKVKALTAGGVSAARVMHD